MRVGIAIVAFVLWMTTSSRAQVSFALSASDQIGTATNEMTFAGSLTNTGSSNVYLNDIQCVLLLSATNVLVIDTNAFYANVPGILLPGETYTDVVFGLNLGSVAPAGDYSGLVTIFGGSNIFAESNLVSAAFEVSLPDSVGDSIPDWWRQLYFGADGSTTNGLSCATCDADGTGQNNLFKYVVGLNPTNSASFFALSNTNSPEPTLAFGPVAAGRAVTPQFIGDLSGDIWQTLTNPTITQTNGSQFVIFDLDASSLQRFYRIQVQIP